jgi:glutathione S-transferase
MAHPVLWQFRVSHYNEKARWALDYKKVPHERRSVLPGFHIPRIMMLSGQKTVPVLILDGKTVADSTRIIEALEKAYPDPPLYPADPAERRRALDLEEYFDVELGPYIRLRFFHEVLEDSDFTAALLSGGFGPGTRRFYRAAFPVIRRLMKFDMKINESTAQQAQAKIVLALERIASEIRPSGYLVGDRFSVADLTAAALLLPLTFPPEFPYPPPQPYPERYLKWREPLRGHRATQWAIDMNRRHRGRSSEIAA